VQLVECGALLLLPTIAPSCCSPHWNTSPCPPPAQALHVVAPPDVAEDIAAVQRQLAAVRFSSSVRQEQLTAALLEVRWSGV